MKQFQTKYLALFFVLLVQACSSTPSRGRMEVNSLSNVKDDEFILVGKIKLVPQLHKSEQKFENTHDYSFITDLFGRPGNAYRNKIFLVMHRNKLDIQSKDILWQDGVTSVDLEKTFFIKAKKSKFIYYSGGIIRIGRGNHYTQRHERTYYPGNFKYRIESGTKAIYIGTIVYHRDEFHNVKKVQIIDEHTQAQDQFTKKFGTTHPLYKAKAILSKNPGRT